MKFYSYIKDQINLKKEVIVKMAKRKRSVTRKAPVKSCCVGSSCKGKTWLLWVVSELATYFFLYYTLFLLNVKTGLYGSTLLLWLLLNVAFFTCPLMRKHWCS